MMVKENVVADVRNVRCSTSGCGRAASLIVQGAPLCAACAKRMEMPVHDRAELLSVKHNRART